MRNLGVYALIVWLAVAACQDSTVGPSPMDSSRPGLQGVRSAGLTASATTVTRGFLCGIAAPPQFSTTTQSVSIQTGPTTSTLICEGTLPVNPTVPQSFRNQGCGTFTGAATGDLTVTSTSGYVRLTCYDTI
ncbi:MAG TPA: hypothetical protein VG799_03845 [Gemmatimonadota bacterium]|nr:hypothetical protein [Gemmatimonadota bacterium]